MKAKPKLSQTRVNTVFLELKIAIWSSQLLKFQFSKLNELSGKKHVSVSIYIYIYIFFNSMLSYFLPFPKTEGAADHTAAKLCSGETISGTLQNFNA